MSPEIALLFRFALLWALVELGLWVRRRLGRG